MISNELNQIVNNFNRQGKMNFLPATTKKNIDDFERKQKIILPSKYKEWLLFSDGGELFLPAGIQLYGIEHKPLIDVDYRDRPNDSYIVIGSLSSGDPILCKKLGEEVSIFNHEAARIEEDEIYTDFMAFLKDLNDLLGIGG